MAEADAVRDFDRIAPVYDATREPLDPASLEALARRLERAECRTLLEVGVGTGRIAAPLTARGFSLVGIDASREMLRRAREKGLPRLLRGDAYHLPLRAGSVDAAFFAHVLHVLAEPKRALAEAARVSRRRVFALVVDRHRKTPEGEVEPGESDEHRRLRALLEAQGYTLPRRERPWQRDRRLLRELPAEESTVLSERIVTETLEERLARIERRADRLTIDVPREALLAAIAAVRAESGSGSPTVTYRRQLSIAAWSPEALARTLAG
jgi:ubiquinone/menaquinone biosynthesis C-methylase UbiE